MNRNTHIMTAMACLTVIFVCTTWAPAQQNAGQDTQIGRYQIAVSNHGYQKQNGTEVQEQVVWAIDTTTSQSWYYSDSSWRRAGRPD